MSEYQHYEFMTIDRPLTREQLDEVNALSSHIKASATHALIVYHWGDFKHNPINVLHKFFDGFLYWANWGSPQLAFRFPHGMLPGDLVESYYLDEFVTFTQHPDYDILDLHFGELQGDGGWVDGDEHELGALIAIRDELLEGDMRALYIAWLACECLITGSEIDDEEDEEDYEVLGAPPVPPALGELTTAQQELAILLQVPQELLDAAALHSSTARRARADDFSAWVELLPADRRNDYLLRLAHNEPGLSRLLVKELRTLGQGKAGAASGAGEQVPYRTLLVESQDIQARMEREKFEQERQAHERRLQNVREHQEDYWRQADLAAARRTSTGYDEALRLLVDLRDAANHFNESQQFQTRFSAWVPPYLRLPSLIKRLRDRDFTIPQA